RRALVEELGIEPSRALQDLERAILRQDTALDFAPAAVTAAEPEPEPAAASQPSAPESEERKIVTVNVLRSRRVHGTLGAAGPRGCAGAPEPVVRLRTGRDRALRRRRREVRRRRRD